MDDSSRNSLALLGRGGAHAIFRYRGADPRLANCVLRVPRAASSAAAGAEFVERTLRPLLGAQYLPPPIATLRLDAAVARALCADAPDAASLARAAAALEVAAAGGAVGSGGVAAQAELDHTRPELAAGAPTLCVELKPKSGALPGGPPLADARPGRCRHCVAIRAKEAAGGPLYGGAATRYCPLALFGAREPAALAAALAPLLDAPHNNLRVFVRGELVFGGACGGARAALRDALRRWFGAEGDGDSDDDAAAEARLLALVARILLREPLLRRLRAAHARDALGSKRALAAYERAAALLGGGAAGEAELVGRLSRWDEAHADAATGGDGGSGSAEVTEAVEEWSLERCVASLRDWLIALTASDASVMLAIAPLGGTAEAERLQPDEPARPGVVADAAGAAFGYRAALVDVLPKPPSKVRDHCEADRRLAARPPAEGEEGACAGAARGPKFS